MKKKTFIWANLAVLDTVFAHDPQMGIVIKRMIASVVTDFFLYSVYCLEVKCLLSLMQTNSERNIDENCEKTHLKIGDQKMSKKMAATSRLFLGKAPIIR